LITLDICLPGQDGFELMQMLKSDEATADIPGGDCVRSCRTKSRASAGRGGLQAKPIDEARLLETVDRILFGWAKYSSWMMTRDTLDLLRQALAARALMSADGKRPARDANWCAKKKPDFDSARISSCRAGWMGTRC